MTIPCKRPQVTDAQLCVLAEVEGTFHDPDGYHRAEGASQAGFRRRSLEQLIDRGYLRRTDTGDADTDGGRYRLHTTPAGLDQITAAVTHRLLVLPWLTRATAEGALF